MTLTNSDLLFFGCTYSPYLDTDKAGGNVIASARVSSDMVQEQQSWFRIQSTEADIRVVSITGKSRGGDTIFEKITLTGVTPVVTKYQYWRLLEVSADDTSPTAVIEFRRQFEDAFEFTAFMTIGVDEDRQTTLFKDANPSMAANVDRYDKLFAKNVDATDTLFAAEVDIDDTPHTGVTFQVGVDLAKDSGAEIANRRTAPTDVVFFPQGTPVPIPTGELAPGESIGIWIWQSIDKNSYPAVASATPSIRILGASI